VPHWVGVAGFSVFVTAMTAGRLAGPRLLDRAGRVVTLWAGAGAALLGLLVTVHASVVPHVLEAPVVVLGVLTWGLGASLGFPVGMSAAADDPRRAAARVSVVSTIGYAAFLAGPPLLGRLGDAVGTLPSLQAVAALMVLAALAVPASRPLGSPARSRP
jgi:MFS family permease